MEVLVDAIQQRRTMRGFKIAKNKLGLEIWEALQTVTALEIRRNKTRAIAALCEELNRSDTVFPGSNLGVRYAIRQAS